MCLTAAAAAVCRRKTMWKIQLTIEEAELLLDAMRRLNKLILLIQMLWSVRPDTAEKLSRVKLIDPTPMIDRLAYLIQKSKDED
jgi:hypothetical protein